MATPHESRKQSNNIELTPLGERLAKIAKTAGITAIAATAGLWGINKVTAETPVNTSATENLATMDKDINHELLKGPNGEDITIKSFAIGPSNTVANAMEREDGRASIDQSTIQLKATTASANNFSPEGIVGVEDQAQMWEDAELTAKYGHSVLLAVPVERPEL